MEDTELTLFPKQWIVSPFLDVIDDITAGNFKVKSQDYLNSGCLSIIDQGQSLIAGYTNNLNYQARTSLPTIIFGDHTRVFKFIEKPFALGADGAKILEPKIPIDKKYLYYYLSQIQLENLGYSRHFKLLKETKIPLPPIPIQRHIARVLDQADQLRKQAQQMETELNALAQSVFLEMFGDYKNFKNTIKLRDLLETIDSGFSPQCETRPVNDNEWGILRLSSITKGYFQENENKYLPDEKIIDKRHKVITGDLLFSRKNTYDLVAATVYVRECAKNVLLPDLIFRFRFKSNYEYLKLYIWGLFNEISFKRKVQNLATGAAGSMPNIAKSSLYDLEIPIITKKDALKFDSTIKMIWGLADKSKNKKNEADILFHSLVQKAFKGELIPTTIEDAA